MESAGNNSLRFTPLYGVQSDGPVSFILEIDEVCILLDCGWNDLFDTELLKPLKEHVLLCVLFRLTFCRVAHKVDLIIISHSKLEHLGALPYAFKEFGLNAPIYTTLPIHKMGQMALYDLYHSQRSASDFGA